MRVIDSDLEIGKEYWFDDTKTTKGKLLKIEDGILYFETKKSGFYARTKEGYVRFPITNINYFHTVDEK